MRDDDRDDPFKEFFNEIEKMMNQMMGPGGEFHFEHNTNRESDQHTHEIHLDIHESDDQIRVIADIPGVDKEAIDLQCDGTTLHLEATNGERRYSERVSLPGSVDEHSAEATYNNGVLGVEFDRVDDSTSIDV